MNGWGFLLNDEEVLELDKGDVYNFVSTLKNTELYT